MDAAKGRIVASLLTGSEVDDGSQVGPLLDQVSGTVAAVLADGAYDRQDVYGAVHQRQPAATVRRAAPVDRGPQRHGQHRADPQRDRHLQAIAEHGRMAWQKATGDTRRALVEAAISRFKRVIGDRLRFHDKAAQDTELAIAVQILNRMLDLGRPGSVRLA